MQTVIIVVHLMIVIAMIAVILLQRSEGGALGIGGGGGGAMFSARGSANLLTRTTTVLAIAFFATSLALGLLARSQSEAPSILGDDAPAGATQPLGAVEGTGEGVLDLLEEQSGESAPPTGEGVAVPTSPAAPPTGAPAVQGAEPAAPQVPTGE